MAGSQSPGDAAHTWDEFAGRRSQAGVLQCALILISALLYWVCSTPAAPFTALRIMFELLRRISPALRTTNAAEAHARTAATGRQLLLGLWLGVQVGFRV